MKKHTFLILLLAFHMYPVAASDKPEDIEESSGGHWMLGVVMGHTWLPAGNEQILGQKAIIVPSWGLDVGYQFNHRFGLKWANEITVQRYVISHDGEELERDNPFVTAIELTVHLGNGFALLAGPGVELEKHKNFFIFRSGIEYELTVGHGWVFFPSVFYESKQGKFGAFTVGFGIGRQFHRKH